MQDERNMSHPFDTMQETLDTGIDMPEWYKRMTDVVSQDVVERKKEYKGKRLQRVKKKKLKRMKLEAESRKHKKELKKLRKEVERLKHKFELECSDDY